MSRLRAFGAALQELALSLPVLLCLVVAIVVYRCYDFLTRPDLRAEDGFRVFAYTMQNCVP